MKVDLHCGHKSDRFGNEPLIMSAELSEGTTPGQCR